jgi:hypothetical protein
MKRAKTKSSKDAFLGYGARLVFHFLGTDTDRGYRRVLFLANPAKLRTSLTGMKTL